jgi:ABC-2 type transport system ATP-binding protein
MLQVKNLSYKVKKAKGSFQLQDISFEMEEGYMMCLLGRNGAGKTTLLDMIYGLIKPDSGEVLWDGKNIRKNPAIFRNAVAYMGMEDGCFNGRSMDENKAFLGLLYENFDSEIYEQYMELFELEESDRTKPYGELSTGQKRKFQLAFALARKPRFFIMDEPFASLDPVVKVDLLEVLHESVTREHMGILLSTHLVEDISDMVDYIGILEEGRMTVFGDRERVLEDYGSNSLRELILEKGRNNQ